MDRHGVLVIGSMNFDTFYTLPHQMRLGENLHASNFQTACGGKGANQAVQCAKLQIPTLMVGCLGNDHQGDQIYAAMSGYGLDMHLVKRVQTPTGNASVWAYPSGEVQAAIYGGANMCITRTEIDEIRPVLERTAIVILQNEIPMETVEYAILVSKAAGCIVIYNAAPALPVSPQALKAVDVLVVNEAEASFYTGIHITGVSSAREGVQKLLPDLSGALIITLGHHGSLIANNGGVHHVPACKVQAVETTGAGDSYVGALAYGLLQGQAVTDAAALATAAAAITVSSIGAQPAMPTLEILMAQKKT